MNLVAKRKKIVVCGAENSGKSTICQEIHRKLSGAEEESIVSPKDVSIRLIRQSSGNSVELWDTQYPIRNSNALIQLDNAAYRNAELILAVFDASKVYANESELRIALGLEFLLKRIRSTKLVLIGNKIDQYSGAPTSSAREFANAILKKGNGAISSVLYTSAFENTQLIIDLFSPKTPVMDMTLPILTLSFVALLTLTIRSPIVQILFWICIASVTIFFLKSCHSKPVPELTGSNTAPGIIDTESKRSSGEDEPPTIRLSNRKRASAPTEKSSLIKRRARGIPALKIGSAPESPSKRKAPLIAAAANLTALSIPAKKSSSAPKNSEIEYLGDSRPMKKKISERIEEFKRLVIVADD